MAKLTIELDPETHQQLKQLATKDERSLTQYIGRVLRQHAGTLTTTTTTITTTNPLNNQKKRVDLIVGEEEDETQERYRRKTIISDDNILW